MNDAGVDPRPVRTQEAVIPSGYLGQVCQREGICRKVQFVQVAEWSAACPSERPRVEVRLSERPRGLRSSSFDSCRKGAAPRLRAASGLALCRGSSELLCDARAPGSTCSG